MAIGFKPNSLGLGLEEVGVELTDRKHIQVDERMSTNIPGIWAVGDVTGKLLLAHVASTQGILCAEAIAGKETRPINYIMVPRATYSYPQVASFGYTETQAKELGKQSKWANSRFNQMEKRWGWVIMLDLLKILVDEQYGEILGAHMIGPEVSELLPELTLAQQNELTITEIVHNIHAHPTLSEALMEAAEASRRNIHSYLEVKMRDLLPIVEKWLSEGKKIAVATVVKIYGSAPQGLGSKMVVNQDGLMAGSVSGGCVEGAVVEEALNALKTNTSRLVVYGITQEHVINFGLACGGNIEVFVEPLSMADYSRMKDDLLNNRLALKITPLTGKHTGNSLFAYPETVDAASFYSPTSDGEIRKLASELLKTQISQRVTAKLDDEEVELFCEVITPLARLMVVGAVHIAIPLVTYANMLGFRTIVVDPRKAFSNRERFPHTDELVTSWPDEALVQLESMRAATW